MQNIEKLRNKLLKIKPLHDTPIGLAHPYWARKPYNIIKLVIEALSNKGDKILDPFMGSGTSVFAGLEMGRQVTGADLNPLSPFIVETLLKSVGVNKRRIHDLFIEYNQFIQEWYRYGNSNSTEFIERERYNVKGKYENGEFSLQLQEVVTKTKQGEKWRNRKAYSISHYEEVHIPLEMVNSPIDFSQIPLVPNSRIAIPTGAYLSHYFTKKNMAAINIALKLAQESTLNQVERDLWRFIISSSLPLLRLSDKKASSQWPYWRPKEMLTSRNPMVVFSERISAIEDAINWLRQNIYSKNQDISYSIINSSIQDLHDLIGNSKFDLVLTDPPYSDQVPYLEYSALWLNILGMHINETAYSQEIVKSDSPHRSNDTKEYYKRLCSSLDICCKFVKEGGYLVWFFQDHDLNTWLEMKKILETNGMITLDVIPMMKQRRSIKTVVSPGATIDGDLVLVFKKESIAKKHSCKPLNLNTNIERYAYLIKRILTCENFGKMVLKDIGTSNLLKIIDKGLTNVLATEQE